MRMRTHACAHRKFCERLAAPVYVFARDGGRLRSHERCAGGVDRTRRRSARIQRCACAGGWDSLQVRARKDRGEGGEYLGQREGFAYLCTIHLFSWYVYLFHQLLLVLILSSSCTYVLYRNRSRR